MITIILSIAVIFGFVLFFKVEDQNDKRGYLFLSLILLFGLGVFNLCLPLRSKSIVITEPIPEDIVEKACPYLRDYGKDEDYGYSDFGQYGKRPQMRQILLRSMSDLCDYLWCSQSKLFLREFKSLSIINKEQDMRVEVYWHKEDFDWHVYVEVGTQEQFEARWFYYMTNPREEVYE